MSKLVVILGPTAVGKSGLAIKLAKKFQGEIISADSRQVYRGMDIGTGKVTKKEQRMVRHHLLDIVSPKKQFTVSDFKHYTKNAIAEIMSRGKTPFIVGGTAFYIYAVIDDWPIPEVKPNPKLRKTLTKKSAAELFIILKNLDSKRAKTIDRHNPARLIRTIEINISTGQPVPPLSFPRPPAGRAGKRESITGFRLRSRNDKVLILGIQKNSQELKKLIKQRLIKRLKQGMVAEVKKLLKSGVSYKRLDQLGLEYRFIAKYLKKKLSYDQLVQQLETAIYQFSRRQMTWFKKDPRIHWVRDPNQAERFVASFLRKQESRFRLEGRNDIKKQLR